MGKFKHMPEELWPDESLHYKYDEVYRAILGLLWILVQKKFLLKL